MANEDIISYEGFNKQRHPEWNDDQVGLKSALDKQADEMLEEDPGRNLTDEFFELLIRRTKYWIEQHLPELFDRVKAAFEFLFDHISEWVANGISYIAQLISDLF